MHRLLLTKIVLLLEEDILQLTKQMNEYCAGGSRC